jgi:hypothetical protein
VEEKPPSKPITVQFQEIKETTEEESKTEKGEYDYLDTIKTCITVGLGTTFAIVQLVLLIIFGMRVLDEESNRYVGITLCCMFIVWSVKVGLEVFSKYFDEEAADEQEEVTENQDMMFKIEGFIYGASLLDYLFRVFENIYFMEEPSVFTPLATAALSLRILYIPLSRFSSSAFIQQLKTFACMQNAVSIYLFFMVTVAAIVASLTTLIIPNSTYSVEVTKHLAALANNNWLQVYTGQGQSDGICFYIKYLLILLGEVVLLKLIHSEAIAFGVAKMGTSIELP